MVITLAKISFLMNIMMGLFVAVAILLILVVLIQKGKGGGLSSMLGGMGASSLLGSKTGDVLTWVTIGLVSLLLVVAVLLDKFLKTHVSSVPRSVPAATMPVEAETPAASTPAPAAAPAAGQPAASGEETTGTDGPAAQPQPAPSERPQTPPAQNEP